jgi:AraC-like DNA-binding protein
MASSLLAQGIPVGSCLAGSGLTETDLQDEDAEIWPHQEFTVIRNIIDILGDRPGIGIEVGKFSTLGRTGVLGFTFLASRTVGEGVERIVPYLALSPSHVRMAIHEADDCGYIVADDSDVPGDIRAFIVERDLAGLAAVLKGAGIDLPLLRLECTLDEQRMPGLAEAWQLDLADVYPDQPQNRLVGPPSMLELPLPQADPNTARVFERQCRELLERRLARVGVTGRVRSRLLHTPGELPAMQTIADELHVDPRTLRRHLAKEGTSFRSLREDVRRTLATNLLAEGFTIEAIAQRLGYAETASFTHAFKRWEGVAPRAFRRRWDSQKINLSALPESVGHP